MTRSRLGLLLLLPSLAWAAPSPQFNLAAIAQTEVINARTYGVVCDGATDDQAALTAAITAAGAGGKVYIPPSATACMLASNLTISTATSIVANPNTVTIKATSGNTSNPVLLNVNAATGPLIIYGVTFDGGGTNEANTNNVVQEFNSSNVTFDHITVQNTRGIGLLISASIVSGVRDSQFLNIGMHWQTSLSGTDRYQGVAFCCTSPQQSAKNFVTGNYFHNIGLDAISMTGQLDYLISNNRCDLGLVTAQFVTLTGLSQYPACVFVSSNTAGIISNNVSDSAPGNAFDIGTTGAHTNLTVTGNFATTSGGAGIAISASNDASFSGNVLINGNQNSADCHLGAISFANTNTIMNVVGNTATDTQGSPTQNYGVYSFTGCSNPATLTNILIDTSNMLAGNKTAAFGGGLSNYVMGTQSINANWTIAPSSGVPLTLTAPSGQFALFINPASGTDAYQVFAGSGGTAQFKLRGNANAGSAAGLFSQDGSSGVHVSNLGAASVFIDTNGSNRIEVTSAGVAKFLGSLQSAGSAFSIASGTGACASTSNITGGALAGSFKCTGTTGASTVTLTLVTTNAAHNCFGRDLTTPTTVTQTGAVSPTSVTLTLTSVNQNDFIEFACPMSY